MARRDLVAMPGLAWLAGGSPVEALGHSLFGALLGGGTLWALGFAQMLGNASAAVGFYFAGRIIRRFGEFRLLIGGKLFSFVVDLFVLLVPTVVSPALTALTGMRNGSFRSFALREASFSSIWMFLPSSTVIL